MILPGRRALGETWSKVHIVVTADGRYEVVREDTQAPADNQGIFVPGLGNMSMEAVDFILEEQRERAKDRAKTPRPPLHAEVNRLWHDFVEQKLRWFKGQTTVGPKGLHQREKVQR